MGREKNRRAFLRLSAGALAAAAPLARALTCAPEPTAQPSERRPLAVFLDESQAPQGPRLDELRARLAALDLGETRLRFEPATVDLTDAEQLRCTIETAVRRNPIAFCTASTEVAVRARPFMGAVPLVFATRTDPVRDGIVDAIGTRRANATGFTYDTPVPIDRKCFELIADAFPGTRRVFVIADAVWQARPGRAEDNRFVAEQLRLQVLPVIARSPSEIADELPRIAPRAGDACFLPRSDVLTQGLGAAMSFLQRHRLPHLFGEERSLQFGGLMSYGPRRQAHWDAVAGMLRLIMAGVSARDIPVQRPREYLLTVNVAQWQRFGLAVPPRVLRRANLIL